MILKKKYYNHTYKELREIYKVSIDTLNKWRRKLDITKAISIPENFKEKYYKHTYKELIEIYGVSRRTLNKWRRKLNLNKSPGKKTYEIPESFIHNYYKMN
jgi:transposase-like protein